ncbi:HAD-IA family hydrolase [Patescibacteria group bacterium]|nr:HAD-IA family hydrolase [Patescibacteria group bacterium]MBU1886022.1 HAD-IA family hydrolase [Patescibacteria group bacterium]
MNKNLVVVFDFDGTIADSAQATIGIFDQLSKEFNLGKSGRYLFDIYREKGARELVKELKIPLRKLPTLLKRYREESARIIKDLKPIRQVDGMLEKLKNEGFALGILTSNSGENVGKFIEKNKLFFFDFIYSEGSFFGKDKVIKKMLKNQHLDSKQTIYVGDEARDIDAARKAGIKVIAATWGFNSDEILKKSNPDYLVNNPKELVEIVKKF